jgi:pyruvate,water dikinase
LQRPAAGYDEPQKLATARRWLRRAVLIERGNTLSRSAIAAREMGILTIVGIAGLVSTLKSGQRVTMDGGAGTVRVEDT